MIETIRQWPSSIFRRWLGLLVIGAACLLVGGAASATLSDIALLFLSGAVFLFVTGKAILLYRLVSRHGYDTLDGICIHIAERPLLKCRSAKLMSDDGGVHTVQMEKRIRLQVGTRYRIYYAGRQDLKSMWQKDDIPADRILGYEELGGYDSDKIISKKLDGL